MLQISLRPTIINDRPLANDFAVIWKSDAFGDNRVGRVRLATERSWKHGEQWEWMMNPPMPVPPWGHGLAASRDLALAAFRKSFERFHSQTAAREFAEAFATQREGAERLQRARQKRDDDVWRP